MRTTPQTSRPERLASYQGHELHTSGCDLGWTMPEELRMRGPDRARRHATLYDGAELVQACTES
jgi:hypothetical protein